VSEPPRASGARTGGRPTRDARLAEVFERTAYAMFVLDDDRIYVDCNPAAEELLECSREEIVGRCADDFIPAEVLARVPAAWARFLRDGYSVNSLERLTARSRRVRCNYSATANFLPGLHLSISIPETRSLPSPPRTRDESGKRLTQREREILARVALGQTGPQIAGELSISRATVRTHIQNIRLKLGAQTRAHAVVLAIQRGEILTESFEDLS
jgi:PAS domain S-box-containing protein